MEIYMPTGEGSDTEHDGEERSGKKGKGKEGPYLKNDASPEAKENFKRAFDRLTKAEAVAAAARVAEATLPFEIRRQKRAAEEIAGKNREPAKFSFHAVVEDSDSETEKPIDLRFVTSTDSEIDLRQFVPELDGVEVFHVSKDAKAQVSEDPSVLKFSFASTDRIDDPKAAATQILDVIAAAVGNKLAETKTYQNAEEKLQTVTSNLYDESSALKRRNKYITQESHVVSALEKKNRATFDRVVEIVALIKLEEGIDLFAPFGDEEKWREQFESQLNTVRGSEGFLYAAKKNPSLAPEHDHGHGHGGHGHEVAPGVLKSVGNVFGGMYKDLAIGVRASEAHAATEIEMAKHDALAKKDEIIEKNGTITEAEIGKIDKATSRTIKMINLKRWIQKYPGTAFKAAGYGLGFAAVPLIGTTLSLWDLSGLPGFKMARTELANWANWILHTLQLPWQIPTGEKKGSGGGHAAH